MEFYWSRTRVLEKLNSLPAGTLPAMVQPTLGPDATALGQIYWYTLEGRDPDGNPTGGWGPEELRTIQDWYARYWLLSADGVAEVGSIGGYVKEYQVDVDPDAMRAYGVTLDQVYHAVMAANIDVGAKTLEINRTEYFIRGIGFIKDLEDIRNSVVKVGRRQRSGARRTCGQRRPRPGDAARRARQRRRVGRRRRGGGPLRRQPAGGHQQREGQDRRDARSPARQGADRRRCRLARSRRGLCASQRLRGL